MSTGAQTYAVSGSPRQLQGLEPWDFQQHIESSTPRLRGPKSQLTARFHHSILSTETSIAICFVFAEAQYVCVRAQLLWRHTLHDEI